VKADEDRSATGLEALRQLNQKPLKSAQFVIYGDPERLKHPSCGVDSVPTTAGNALSHQISQILGRLERVGRPVFHNPPRDAPAKAFLAQLPKNICQLSFAQPH
jgi:hypothetical protein